MTTIYLGMALSGTEEWWRDTFYKSVLAGLEGLPSVHVSRFVGLDASTQPKDVYDFDMKLAAEADLMVALTRFPSIGLGMEIQSRATLEIPTAVFHPEDEYLSKMPCGAPCVDVYRYSINQRTLDEQANQICSCVQNILSG